MTLQIPPTRWATALDVLCPMHVQVKSSGHIQHIGPTLRKLRPDMNWTGQPFFDVFELLRPRNSRSMQELIDAGSTKLHLKFQDAPQTGLHGIVVPSPSDSGALINLSFGMSVLDAVHEYTLTNADFAATDLAIELLFLVEAKTAAMEASRSLNQRLQKAKVAAEEQAFTDPLTGLRNRRAVEGVLEQHLADQTAFSFLQLDLDYFKAVNDTFGHAAGDHVLQVVAKRLLAVIRDEDTVARIGGDEFVIVIDGSVSRERLAEVSTDIITSLCKPIYFEGQLCAISTSVGISNVSVNRRLDLDQVMQEADKALYVSKANGRSQFSFYDEI